MTIPHPDSVAQPSEPKDIVEIDFRPAGRSVLPIAGGWLLFAIIVLIVGWGFAAAEWAMAWRGAFLLGPVALLVAVLMVAAIIRNSYRYQLTRHRVRAAWGVLSRVSVESRLEDLRNVTVVRSLPQRLLALGTIHMTTAGMGPPVSWPHVTRPADRAEQVRRAIDAARITHAPSSVVQGGPIFPQMSAPAPVRRIPVLGLAGGIGAGKSTVARAFERVGCFVVDSDARAKVALDRPDVRDALRGWWGDSILAPGGRVDRSRVAAIIFSDPEQRARLEQLVHPIVREDRAAMIRQAAAAQARAVIVDAPLLFEAGVDAECDAVVFVDAPRGQRLERVRQTRNWDEEELSRREAAQIPLDEKRGRSRYVVENSGKLGQIDVQVAGILSAIEAGT